MCITVSSLYSEIYFSLYGIAVDNDFAVNGFIVFLFHSLKDQKKFFFEFAQFYFRGKKGGLMETFYLFAHTANNHGDIDFVASTKLLP